MIHLGGKFSVSPFSTSLNPYYIKKKLSVVWKLTLQLELILTFKKEKAVLGSKAWASYTKAKAQTEDTEQVSDRDSDMTVMLELLNREFQTDEYTKDTNEKSE